MKAGSSRRDFIRRTFFGAAIGGLVAKARGASSSAQTGSPSVHRRRLGRLNADVSILGLGLGGAFMDWYDRNLETGCALLESALMKGINCWDTARSYGPSEGMIAPVLARNRNGVFLMSKSDARDYEGFKRDLHRSLQILGTDYIDVYHLHDMRSHELANLSAIESGAVRAAREAKEQKIIRGFGVTGHSGAVILIECVKRFDPDVILTIFPATRPDNGRYEDELLPLARGRKIGVIAMKTIRYGRHANLPAKELLRYALSLNGVDAAIVGLDSQAHLNENASIASSFKPMKEADRTELHGKVGQALAGIPAPWDRPGYIDGQIVT
jgi:uncharacterized protein